MLQMKFSSLFQQFVASWREFEFWDPWEKQEGDSNARLKRPKRWIHFTVEFIWQFIPVSYSNSHICSDTLSPHCVWCREQQKKTDKLKFSIEKWSECKASITNTIKPNDVSWWFASGWDPNVFQTALWRVAGVLFQLIWLFPHPLTLLNYTARPGFN